MLSLVVLLALAPESSRAAFERAAGALSRGDYARAERGFLAVLESEPRNVGALGNLGVVYSRTRRPEKAIGVYRQALKVAPGDPALLLNLGLAYAKAERHGEAVAVFQEVLKRNPRHAQAGRLLAASQLYSGQVDAATATLESLPADPAALYLLGVARLKQKRPAEARAVFERMIGQTSPAQGEFLLGRAYYESSLFEQAEEALLAVRRLDPAFPGLRLALGKLYISQRRTDDALVELKAALAQDPADADATYYLGGSLAQEARCGEALPYLEKARAALPDSWGTLYYLGKCRLTQGDAAGAVPFLERAAELNPDEASVHYQLGRALKSAGREEDARAAMVRVRRLRAGALKEEIDILSGR